MTLLTGTKLTADQFILLNEDPPGVRTELINGEIRVSPSPSFGHSYVEKKLSLLLLSHIDQHDLGALVGDVDTIFGTLNVRRPDIIFIAKDRLHHITGRTIPIAPDLCVEIISPSTASVDRGEKFELYAKHGVPHYWLVDAEVQTFEAYRLTHGKYVLGAAAGGADTLHAEPFADLEIQLSILWPPAFGK